MIQHRPSPGLAPRVLGLAALPLALLACGTSEPPPAAAPLVTAAPEEHAGPKEAEYATIDVLCEPPTPILLDGKPIGTTPISSYKVTPGKHDVTFNDEEHGSRTLTVDVNAGEGKTVVSDRPRTKMTEGVGEKKDEKGGKEKPKGKKP
jgi:hypothetical protein